MVVDLPVSPGERPATAAGPRGDEVVVLAAAGVEVDAATRAAAAYDMGTTGVHLVDLIPGDLPAEAALRVLSRVDVERLGTDPLYAPGGAHEAVVLHPELARRMGITPSGESLARGDLMRRTLEAQRCAPTAAVLRRAPGLAAGPRDPGHHWDELCQATASSWPQVALAPAIVAGETVHLLALTAGLLVAPIPAAAALAAWAAQPAVVLGRRHLGHGLLRLPRAWAGNVRTAVAGSGQRRAADHRATATAATIPADEEMFEPRRATCPWCGSGSLTDRLDTTDLLQFKPGAFHLDQCTDCGHVFQNPALSPTGLDYYYDEFYDGVGEDMWESAFAGMGRFYQRRVEAVAQVAEPRTWLDVGAGHGHFCLAARQRWPEARFDGLDMSESIEEAVRRGWVDRGYRGLFPEMADGLPGSYDVVSMHHYLEHTRDPRQELQAALKVLEPGGHLMIEVPDPESPWARRLGRYWTCWFQPQHQHLVPCDNLVEALGETGFDVVSVERGPATMGGDLGLALMMLVASRVPSPHFAWRPPASRAERTRRIALLTAALPALALAAAADAVKDGVARRDGNTAPGNAYRVVARRR